MLSISNLVSKLHLRSKAEPNSHLETKTDNTLTPSPLLSLPRELRDQIYSYLFTPTDIVLTFENSNPYKKAIRDRVTLWKRGHSFITPESLNPLRGVCRLLHAETLGLDIEPHTWELRSENGKSLLLNFKERFLKINGGSLDQGEKGGSWQYPASYMQRISMHRKSIDSTYLQLTSPLSHFCTAYPNASVTVYIDFFQTTLGLGWSPQYLTPQGWLVNGSNFVEAITSKEPEILSKEQMEEFGSLFNSFWTNMRGLNAKEGLPKNLHFRPKNECFNEELFRAARIRDRVPVADHVFDAWIVHVRQWHEVGFC
jgi:hypothetical protein